MRVQTTLRILSLALLGLTIACGDAAVEDGNATETWRPDAPRADAGNTPVADTGNDPEPDAGVAPDAGVEPEATGETRDEALEADIDGNVEGELSGQDDEVWFRFVAGNAYSYAIYTSGDIDTQCGLYLGENGEALAEDDDSGEGLNCRIEQQLRNGRTYYVRVGSFQGRGEGSFQLHIDAQDAPTIDPQIVVQPDPVQAGAELRIAGTGFSPNGSVTLEFNGMGELSAPDATADADGIIDATVAIPLDQDLGRYQLRAVDQSSETPSRFVTFDITSAPADDHGNGADDATNAGNGGTFEGVLTDGDVDTFRLNVNRNGEWVIHTEGNTDTHCTLLDSEGAEVAVSDDDGEGTNCRIAQELTGPAQFIISIRHFRANGSGDYTLVITPPDTPVIDNGGGQNDDHADQIEGASLLLPIVPAMGAFDKENDQDWFTFLAPVSGMYTFATIGFVDTFCALYDADGNLLTEDDNSGPLLNCEIVRALNAGQIVHIRVTQGRLRFNGQYTLVAAPPAEQGGDDHGNDLNAANFVDDNGQFAGNIEEGGDIDVVRVRATRTGPYRFATSGALDTVCRLLDHGGNELATNDDGGEGLNCQIDQNLVAGQVYAFSVRAFSAQATGAYTMSITLP